ncbi:MAG: hypothetical protein KBA58_02810, partial [Methanomassiliicoccales archaeon]|nr:hypothetical protein [Methanomassiliicoccales archaeon]
MTEGMPGNGMDLVVLKDHDPAWKVLFEVEKASMAEEPVRASGLDWTILRPSGIYGPNNVDDVAYYFITSFKGFASRFII